MTVWVRPRHYDPRLPYWCSVRVVAVLGVKAAVINYWVSRTLNGAFTQHSLDQWRDKVEVEKVELRKVHTGAIGLVQTPLMPKTDMSIKSNSKNIKAWEDTRSRREWIVYVNIENIWGVAGKSYLECRCNILISTRHVPHVCIHFFIIMCSIHNVCQTRNTVHKLNSLLEVIVLILHALLELASLLPSFILHVDRNFIFKEAGVSISSQNEDQKSQEQQQKKWN